jgi:hypothetical protein
MQVAQCDRCEKRTPLRSEGLYGSPNQLPLGWSRVIIVLTEELSSPVPPAFPLRKMAEALPLPEEARPFVERFAGEYEKALQPPIAAPVEVQVTSQLELCPDCAERFFQASGCDEKIKRQPDLPPPHRHFGPG